MNKKILAWCIIWFNRLVVIGFVLAFFIGFLYAGLTDPDVRPAAIVIGIVLGVLALIKLQFWAIDELSKK